MPEYTDTLVMFRIDTRGEFAGEVTAIFPEYDGVKAGEYMGYVHIGQHIQCSRDWIYSKTRPASRREYGPLLAELVRIGYENLRVCKRWPNWRYLEKRRRALANA